jgi:hypothetical protein
MIFITNNQTTKVLEPSKEPFHFPPLLIATQATTVLGLVFPSIIFMWSNQLNTAFIRQFLIQLVTVIRSVTNHFFGQILGEAGIQRLIYKLDFMRLSTGCVNGDRKTKSVCEAHNFGSFALFGFTHAIAPFFAGAKVPSMKPSLRSMPPRSFKSRASAVSSLAKTPDSLHSWKRRWHVLFGGYRSGRSAHWAPVRKIQRMPLRIALGSCGGLPDFPGWALGFGMYSTIRCHCSFVRSIGHISALT